MLSIFKKKNKEKKTLKSAYFTLRIRDIIRETDDAITIVFDNPNQTISYKAGQFITLILNVHGEKVRRSYSLCSSPYVDDFLAVTVKKVDGGSVSHFINEELKPGDTVEVMEPMGNFTTEFNSGNERTFVIFAGGSGITPLMSIIKSALDQEPHSRIILVYQNRTEASIIFNKEINQLKFAYPDRFAVEHVLSNPDMNWSGMFGRLSEQHVDQIFKTHVKELNKAHVFLCGPRGMMQTVESGLDKLGIGMERRYKESFTSSSEKSTSVSKEEQVTEFTESSVTILLDDEEYNISVKPKDFILETALDAGIDMPFSCQSGLCTACRGKLVSGEVSMEEPDGLSDSELDEGYILCCVSHPASPDIKIIVG